MKTLLQSLIPDYGYGSGNNEVAMFSCTFWIYGKLVGAVKKNKGFSLIELVVVVLIMGVIAVVMAPQVMKWVGTARTNSGNSVSRDIKVAVQAAVAEYTSAGNIVTGCTNLDVTQSDIAGLTETNGIKSLGAYIDETLGGDYPDLPGGGYFTLTINTDGTVKVYPE